MARALALVALVCLACPPPSAIHFTMSEPATTGEGSSGSSSSGSSSGGDDSSGTSGGSEGGSGTTDTGTTTSTTTSASATTVPPDTTAGGTTEPPPEEFPLCGNAKIDGSEECDDGNDDPGDLCDVCKRARHVFVTSVGFTPNNIGGIGSADDICKQFAGKGQLPGWQGYSAWLSDSTSSARDRIYHGLGRYVRVDGVEVASNVEQFFSGALLAPIGIDENGQAVNDNVWTGTLPDGTAVPGADHCDDWTMFSLSKMGHVGDTLAIDARWTMTPVPEINPQPCASTYRLYCFEGK